MDTDRNTDTNIERNTDTNIGRNTDTDTNTNTIFVCLRGALALSMSASIWDTHFSNSCNISCNTLVKYILGKIAGEI